MESVGEREDAVQVAVRVRPPVEREIHGLQRCVALDKLNNAVLLHGTSDRVFTYDWVADEDTSQEEVFVRVGRGVVETCMEGYNGTVFAYGQTGSGKTYTMMGPTDEEHNRGLIPRMLEHLFRRITMEQQRGVEFSCRVSFCQIYNETITDLLSPMQINLMVREDLRRGVYVEGLTEHPVADAAEAHRLMLQGARARRVGSTAMNQESSRSHSLFTVHVESRVTDGAVINTRFARLSLVDLAGSERQTDTHAAGETLREASHINKSLSTLGRVIKSLCERERSGTHQYVQYRDSKLTFLLRDSLGGNTKTWMIAAVSPSLLAFGETMSTLLFASSAKMIKNRVTVNEDVSGSTTVLQAEVKRLRAELSAAHAVIEQQRGASSLGDRLAYHPKLIALAGDESPEQIVAQDKLLLEALDRLRDTETQLSKAEQRAEEAATLAEKRQQALMSAKTIIRLREERIKRLMAGAGVETRCPSEIEAELVEEIEALRAHVQNHPEVVRFAMENIELREAVKECVELHGDVEQRRKQEAERADTYIRDLHQRLHAALLEKKALADRLARATEAHARVLCGQHRALEARAIAAEQRAEELQTALDALKLAGGAGAAQAVEAAASVAAAAALTHDAQRRELEAALQEERERTAALQAALDAVAVRDKLAAETDTAVLQQRLEELRRELAAEKDRADELDHRLQTAQAEAQQAVERALQEARESREELDTRTEEAAVLRAQLASTSAALFDATQQRSAREDAERRLSGAGDRAASLLQECDRLRAELDQTLRERSLLESKLQATASELRETRTAYADLQSQLAGALQSLRDAEAVQSAIQDENAAAVLAQADMELRLKKLEEQNEQLAAELAVTAADRDRLMSSYDFAAATESQWRDRATQLEAEVEAALARPACAESAVQTEEERRAAEEEEKRAAAETTVCQVCVARETELQRVTSEWEALRERKNREIAELKQTLDERDAALAAAQAWASESEAAAAGNERARRGLERQLGDAQDRIAQLARETERLTDANMALEGTAAQLRSQLCDFGAQNQSLLSEMRSMQEESQRSFAAMHAERTRAESLEAELVGLRQRVAALSEENAQLAGHHNTKQRIQHVKKVKEEYNQLQETFEALQKHTRRCEDELRRLKRIPLQAELTFDEEEERRRAEAAQAREECARLSVQMTAVANAINAAAAEAGMPAEAVAVPLPEAIRRLGARAASAAHEAATTARLLSLHQRQAELQAAMPGHATPGVARPSSARAGAGPMAATAAAAGVSLPPAPPSVSFAAAAAAAAAPLSTPAKPAAVAASPAVGGTPSRIPRVATLAPRTPAAVGATPRRPAITPATAAAAARRPGSAVARAAALIGALPPAQTLSPRTPGRPGAGGAAAGTVASPLLPGFGPGPLSLRPQTPLQVLMASVNARSRSHTPVGVPPRSAVSQRSAGAGIAHSPLLPSALTAIGLEDRDKENPLGRSGAGKRGTGVTGGGTPLAAMTPASLKTPGVGEGAAAGECAAAPLVALDDDDGEISFQPRASRASAAASAAPPLSASTASATLAALFGSI